MLTGAHRFAPMLCFRLEVPKNLAALPFSCPPLAQLRGATWAAYSREVEFGDALQILSAMERSGVRYVLVGSMAMAAQGLVRATRDMDFFVSPEPDNVARLKAALRSVFDDPSIDEISAEDLGGDYPAIQYVPPDGDISLDILARLGDAFRFEDLESETLLVDGISIRVATPGMLYRMKRDTVRPQDKADAEALRQRFRLGEG